MLVELLHTSCKVTVKKSFLFVWHKLFDFNNIIDCFERYRLHKIYTNKFKVFRQKKRTDPGTSNLIFFSIILHGTTSTLV